MVLAGLIVAQVVIGGGGQQSTERKWMSFVDGENFTIRAQGLDTKITKGQTKVESLTGRGMFRLSEGPFWSEDRFMWIPGVAPRSRILQAPGGECP